MAKMRINAAQMAVSTAVTFMNGEKSPSSLGPVFARVLQCFWQSASIIGRVRAEHGLILGGIKNNVVPGVAEVLIHHQMLPLYRLEEVVNRDKYYLRHVPNLTIDVVEVRCN